MKTLGISALFILLPVLAVLSGCDAGRQKGLFAVSGDRTSATTGLTGRLVQFRGNAQDPAGTSLGPEATLLNFLIVLPGVHGASGSSTNHAHLSTRSTVFVDWDLGVGRLAFDAIWDRVHDKVIVANETFDRRDGNVFVAILTDSRTFAVHQLEGEGESLTLDEIVERAKSQLSDKYPFLIEVSPIDTEELETLRKSGQ